MDRRGIAEETRALIARLPKAEVHLHLEGTISPETLWAIAQANHARLPVGSLEELRGLYRFESFDGFVELWLAMCSCLRRPQDYERMVDGFVSECVRQNIRYAELHFTPFNHERFGFGGRRALQIVTERLLSASGGPEVRLILDIPSESADVSGPYTAGLLEEEHNPLVAAIGLGGPEQGFPRRAFAPWFERARRAGYRAVAHAGETAGPEHVREAVVDLGAVRIQHGVRAVEDPDVLKLLAERRVCCDVTLSSNVCLKVVPSIAAHPLRRMMEAGVPVTLSTDDPPFFGTDLLGEWELALRSLGLGIGELWDLNLNGLRHALAETAVIRRLFKEFEAAARREGITVDPEAEKP